MVVSVNSLKLSTQVYKVSLLTNRMLTHLQGSVSAQFNDYSYGVQWLSNLIVLNYVRYVD